MDHTLYNIPVCFADGTTQDLSAFEGKYLLIVNVASQCGYTNQYSQLQELQNNFSDKLVVIGCPCNDFGGQEPGTVEEIVAFCTKDFGVTFPLTLKISITNDPHPLYQWLMSHANRQNMLDEVKWNFHKFLVSPEGELLGSFSSAVSPISEDILELIK